MGNRLVFILFAVPLLATELRIGVLSLFRPERVSVRSTQVLQVNAGPRLTVLAPGQVAGMRAEGMEVDLFAQQQQSSAQKVIVSGRGGSPAEFQLKVEGKIDRKFTGRLEVTAVGSRLEPVILVDLESAVAATIAAEMPRDTPPEAYKAMAVVARTYYLASGRRHGSFDFCDTTHCQWRRETLATDHPASIAAAATKDIILTFDGKPFPAMYHASCGDRTKSAAEVGLSSDPYPYFPVDCAACKRDSPAWTRRLPLDVAGSILKAPTEAHRLEIGSHLGWDALPSNNYSAMAQGETVVVTGRGEGHGLGVCQRGIAFYARSGEDFRALLTRYLPQTRTVGR